MFISLLDIPKIMEIVYSTNQITSEYISKLRKLSDL